MAFEHPLPGPMHNRPGYRRYRRAYLICHSGPKSVSMPVYAQYISRHSLDAAGALLKIRHECLKQLAHRLYPLLGRRNQSRQSFFDQCLGEAGTMMSHGISVKHAPSRRLMKKLKSLFLYIKVSEYATKGKGRRYRITCMPP